MHFLLKYPFWWTCPVAGGFQKMLTGLPLLLSLQMVEEIADSIAEFRSLPASEQATFCRREMLFSKTPLSCGTLLCLLKQVNVVYGSGWQNPTDSPVVSLGLVLMHSSLLQHAGTTTGGWGHVFCYEWQRRVPHSSLRSCGAQIQANYRLFRCWPTHRPF